jgi:hypothetical protein
VGDAKGRFLPGPDPDRRRLTPTEKQKGFVIAMEVAKMPCRTRAWLRKKIRNYYLARRGRRDS